MRLVHWATDRLEHLVALALIRDPDWHVLFCGCGTRGA